VRSKCCQEVKLGGDMKQPRPPQWRLRLVLLAVVLSGRAVDRSVFEPGRIVIGRNSKAPNNSSVIACIWSPKEQEECRQLLTSRLPFTPGTFSRYPGRIGHRWILLGDSTVSKLAKSPPLHNTLVRDALWRIPIACGGNDTYELSHVKADRCRFNQLYGLKYRVNNEWTPPDYANNTEGPVRYGAKNPHCTDCSGCYSDFVMVRDGLLSPEASCHIDKDAPPLVYGGFLSVEFARDVEMQTPEYRTTQENIAAFLSRTFNSDRSVEAFGRPVCVVCVGHHDVLIPGITLSRFVENVEWYLGLLIQECEHILYIGNTPPATDKFRQKKGQTREWNQAVRSLLERSPQFREKCSFLDPFDASLSLDYSHDGNIHMDARWYHDLAHFLVGISIEYDEAPSSTIHLPENRSAWI